MKAKKDRRSIRVASDDGLDSRKFLGRTFDHDTMTYVFSDGSGRVPEEMRQDVINATYERNCFGRNGLHVLATLFAWKDRLESNVLLSGAATTVTGNSAPSHRVRSN